MLLLTEVHFYSTVKHTQAYFVYVCVFDFIGKAGLFVKHNSDTRQLKVPHRGIKLHERTLKIAFKIH